MKCSYYSTCIFLFQPKNVLAVDLGIANAGAVGTAPHGGSTTVTNSLHGHCMACAVRASSDEDDRKFKHSLWHSHFTVLTKNRIHTTTLKLFMFSFRYLYSFVHNVLASKDLECH